MFVKPTYVLANGVLGSMGLQNGNANVTFPQLSPATAGFDFTSQSVVTRTASPTTSEPTSGLAGRSGSDARMDWGTDHSARSCFGRLTAFNCSSNRRQRFSTALVARPLIEATS